MSKLSIVNEVGRITGARFQDLMTPKHIFDPKPVRLNRDSLGTPIRQWEVDDKLRNPNPLD